MGRQTEYNTGWEIVVPEVFQFLCEGEYDLDFEVRALVKESAGQAIANGAIEKPANPPPKKAKSIPLTAFASTALQKPSRQEPALAKVSDSVEEMSFHFWFTLVGKKSTLLKLQSLGSNWCRDDMVLNSARSLWNAETKYIQKVSSDKWYIAFRFLSITELAVIITSFHFEIRTETPGVLFKVGLYTSKKKSSSH